MSDARENTTSDAAESAVEATGPPGATAPSPAAGAGAPDEPAAGGEATPDTAPGAASEPAPVPAKKAPKAPPPPKAPRDLPAAEEIAAWIEGADAPRIGELFAVPLAKWDAVGMQIKKEELLPQHWQVLTAITSPDDAIFESLPEVGRLRVAYRDQELSRRRLAALREAWRALRGKQPSLWTVSDLFAAVRRLMDRKVAVDWHDLLSAVRDLWAGMSVPHGREQLEVLWACLDFIRSKSK
jgi:hypothetical protein